MDRNDIKISLIVPVRDVSPLFHQVLQALGSLNPVPHEVIIVYDGTTDRVQKPESLGCDFRETVMDRNRGPAAARNNGARQATGTILLFVDADVFLPVNSIQLVSDFFNHGGDACIALFSHNPPVTRAAARFKNCYMRTSYEKYEIEDRCPAFLSSAAAIRRELFEQTGGYDEKYRRPSVEDAELGRRINGQGIRISVLGEWLIDHGHDYSTLELLGTAFSRAASVIRMNLRVGKAVVASKRTAPRGFRLSLPLPLATLFFIFLSLFTGWKLTLLLVLATVLVLYPLNASFLSILKKQYELKTFLFALGYLPLDICAHTCGIIWGILGYQAGNKY